MSRGQNAQGNSKLVLITGCNGGIGVALCEVFKQSGYVIAGVDIHPQCKFSTDFYFSCDLSELVDSDKLQGYLFEKLRQFSNRMSVDVNVLINNAASQVLGSIEQISSSEFRRCLDINVTAPFIMGQIFSKVISGKARGKIVNIGSIHSRLTKAGFSAYSVSKAALSGLTRAMALDLSEKINVNIIIPAAIETDMLIRGFDGNREKLEALLSYHPIGRIAKPIEVARLALYLCSDDAEFITGSEISIDGGIGVRLYDPG